MLPRATRKPKLENRNAPTQNARFSNSPPTHNNARMADLSAPETVFDESMGGVDPASDDDMALIGSGEAEQRSTAQYERYDAHSSDEEDAAEEGKDAADDEEEQFDENAAHGYAALEEEEFGDFAGFESDPAVPVALGAMALDSSEDGKDDDTSSLPSVPLPDTRRNIPPLTKGECSLFPPPPDPAHWLTQLPSERIDLIKGAMAGLNIRPPSSMSGELPSHCCCTPCMS